MYRRELLIGLVASTFGGACKKGEPRCNHCGMRIDPSSAWRTDLTLASGGSVSFDTPWCALTSWRSGKTAATAVRVQDYYDRLWRDGAELRFVVGGDVVGPMGPDLIPVDPSRATTFLRDHAADRVLLLEEVTPEVLAAVKNPK